MGKNIYQQWHNKNVFAFGGRAFLGPDWKMFVLSEILILGLGTTFLIMVCIELGNHRTWAFFVIGVLWVILDMLILLKAAIGDPGVIPRYAAPPQPKQGDTDIDPRLGIPRFREVEVNGHIVKVKFCDTCNIYRPPRTSHCSVCNNCVERFDHHCPWVGQCIGRRNYRFFYTFVVCTALLTLYVFVVSIYQVIVVADISDYGIGTAFIKRPATIVVMVIMVPFFLFTGGLTMFHTYLIGTNQTTYENFRYKHDRKDNPYNLGVWANFKDVIFSRRQPSRLDFRAEEQYPFPQNGSTASAPAAPVPHRYGSDLSVQVGNGLGGPGVDTNGGGMMGAPNGTVQLNVVSVGGSEGTGSYGVGGVGGGRSGYQQHYGHESAPASAELYETLPYPSSINDRVLVRKASNSDRAERVDVKLKSTPPLLPR